MHLAFIHACVTRRRRNEPDLTMQIVNKFAINLACPCFATCFLNDFVTTSAGRVKHLHTMWYNALRHVMENQRRWQNNVLYGISKNYLRLRQYFTISLISWWWNLFESIGWNVGFIYVLHPVNIWTDMERACEVPKPTFVALHVRMCLQGGQGGRATRKTVTSFMFAIILVEAYRCQRSLKIFAVIKASHSFEGKCKDNTKRHYRYSSQQNHTTRIHTCS